LQVAADGSRSWLFHYSRHDRTRDVGLGPMHAVKLDEAREKARECRRLLGDGIDPLKTRIRKLPWRRAFLLKTSGHTKRLSGAKFEA
jgi:hypothetical protein